ncbi:MAG: adenylate/guanylate cyclase domain-containing protein [Ornithinibacter sp.]
MSACQSCGAVDQPPGGLFCNQCGSPLNANCAQCSAPLAAGARFCSQCGTPAGATGDAVTPPYAGGLGGSGPVSERRVTSVLFCDLVGFTTLSEARDHEETRELLTHYFDEARRIIGRYGGTVEKFIGDAVMAVWGVPIAHEDDAERAVRAGLELVTTIGDIGDDQGLTGLAGRVGIVTGEVAVTVGAVNQGMVAGDAVNTASRVQSVANPGQVWVDETTRLLSAAAITYSDVGSHLLKGKADPMPLWSARAVVAARGGAQRADGLEAPLVGRDRELRLVKELFHSSEASRRPALLLVDGEAGVGKTRLAWEFEKYIDGLTDSVMWHTGRCLAYGEGVAFWAVAEAVRGRMSADGGDPDQEPGALLETALSKYGVTGEEREWMKPRLEVLLGLATQDFPKEDLFAAWTAFFERLGDGSKPVVIVIDDAQYADDGLLEFVEHLITWATVPLLVLMMTRPGLLERRMSLATHRNSTVIHASSLDDDAMATLLDGLVSGLSDRTRAGLVDRAEGIPLYAVETVRSLIDRDLVVPRGGVYVLATNNPLDLESIAAPASLQALVAARLDALSPDQHHVVNVASVLGATLGKERIAELCPTVEDINDVLQQLVHLQILERQSSRLSAEFGRYSFRQSVVHQVAYATLSMRERKRIHLAIIDAYGAVEDLASDQAAVLAQHHLDAIKALPGDDDVSQLRGAAISLLLVAARRARSLGLLDDSVEHLRTAIRQETDPASLARLRAELAGVLLDATLWVEAADVAALASAALLGEGEEIAAASAAAKGATALARQNRFEEAHEIAWPLWLKHKDDPHATRASLDLSEALLTQFSRQELPDQMVRILDDRARLAEKLGNPIDIANVTLALALRYQEAGVYTISSTLIDTTAQIAREHQLPLQLARALVNRCAYFIGTDAARAVETGREAIVAGRRTGITLWASVADLNFALALWVRGEWQEMGVFMGSQRLWMPGGDVACAMAIDAMLASARGETADDSFLPPSEQDLPIVLDRAWLHFARAHRSVIGGDPQTALRHAVLAAEAYVGVNDDFHHLFALAMDLALAVGDRQQEAQVLELVDSVNAALPFGLRAHRARYAAVVAQRDGAPPEDVERLLTHALDLYDEWGALAFSARSTGELGSWLVGQERAGEGIPLVESARSTLSGIGARRWLEDLELSLVATARR